MPENDDLKTSICSDKQNINYNENKILTVSGKNHWWQWQLVTH